MPHRQAANIVAIRNVLEDMMIKTANDPGIISDPTHEHGRVSSIIRSLCRSNAGRHITENAASFDRR